MKPISDYTDPDKMLERFQKTAEERQKRELEELEQRETAKVIQLDLWPEAKRGTPNSALRGSLFAAISPNNRKAFERALIVDEEKLKIRFTGIQLDQSDLDVWEMALHMARVHKLGHVIEFTTHGFLKSLGRSTGKMNHEWLKKALSRLTACCVEITHENMTYADNLVSFWRDEDTGRYRLEINPKIARLYSVGYTAVDWQDRQKIGNRKPLALWLHSYISSHAKLYPTKIETFHRLSGSSNKRMRDFKHKLNTALQHLQDKELIRGFRIEGNLVHIQNIPTASQQKHLSNR